MSAQTTPCPACGHETQTVVGRCPNCGQPKERRGLASSTRPIQPWSLFEGLGFFGAFIWCSPGVVLTAFALFVVASIPLTVLGIAVAIAGLLVAASRAA